MPTSKRPNYTPLRLCDSARNNSSLHRSDQNKNKDNNPLRSPRVPPRPPREKITHKLPAPNLLKSHHLQHQIFKTLPPMLYLIISFFLTGKQALALFLQCNLIPKDKSEIPNKNYQHHCENSPMPSPNHNPLSRSIAPRNVSSFFAKQIRTNF